MRTLAYGAHPEQVVDVHAATGEPRASCVALIHGGCWRARYDRSLSARLVADLVGRGYQTWNLEYRRLDAGGTWPEPIDDVVSALRLCPTPPAVIGHSAGGYLALLAASRLPLAGVVAQAPVSDLPAARTLGACHGAVDRLLAAGAPAVARAARGVPTLVVHGDEDTDVPGRISAGDEEAERVEVPDCGHMEHLDPTTQAWQLVVEWLERRT